MSPMKNLINGDRARIIAFGVLPAGAVLLGAGAAVLKYQDAYLQGAQRAAKESVDAARQTTETILSYRADTVDRDLNAARDRLTGAFLDSYSTLINETVIPGAREKKISTDAKVPAAASVSATSTHAVVLAFVNQTVTMGSGDKASAPTTTASSVRVTLDKVDGRWLVSGFDPLQ